VPEDIQSVLSDTELFNNMPDLTTKEILKRYGEVAKQPDRHFGASKPEAADMPPVRTADSPTASSRSNGPVPTRIETDPQQLNAWQKESSVRHVQQNGSAPHGSATFPQTNQKTPMQHYQQDGFMNPSPYHHRVGSSESAQSQGHLGQFAPRPTGPAGPSLDPSNGGYAY
jgi:hypothetical protein